MGLGGTTEGGRVVPEIKAKVIELTDTYLLFWAAPPPDFEPTDYADRYDIMCISPGQCRFVNGKLTPVGGDHMYYADPSFMAVLREGGVEDE